MTDLMSISRKAATVAAIALIAAAVTAPPALAQALYGAIVGTIVDQSGAPVPGATVTATNTGTGLKVDTQTDADGNYTFRNLQPGIYDCTPRSQRFPRAQEDGRPRQRRQPGPRRTSSSRWARWRRRYGHRRDDAPADGEGRPAHGADVEGAHQPSPEPVPELPGAAEPGPGGDAGAVPERGDRHAGPRAAARASTARARNNNAFRIDGARLRQRLAAPPRRLRAAGRRRSRPSTSPPTTSTPTRAWPAAPRSTVMTKSGTNQLHGSAFFFRNQDELNANTFVNNAAGMPSRTSPPTSTAARSAAPS